MFSLFLRFVFASSAVFAQQLEVDIGTELDFAQLANNIVTFLAASIGFVSVAIFIFGAFKLTASAFNEEWRNQGKDLMIKSLVAMVIVLGAYAILRTVAFFILA